IVCVVLGVLGCAPCARSQNLTVSLTATDDSSRVVQDAYVYFDPQTPGQKSRRTRTGANGKATIEVESATYKIRVRHIAYRGWDTTLTISQNTTLTARLRSLDVVTAPVQISDERRRTDLQQKPFEEVLPIDLEEAYKSPTPKLDVESLIQRMPGVASSSEFSSQYRVRGGNYDENLIYINDVEIYRPQLVRAGQQEGLGVTNPSLTDEVTFSTGGFGAHYGDKLSSVLNLTYKTPKRFRASAEAGLLTLNAHVEGSTKNKTDSLQSGRFTYLVGVRRFSAAYLLRSLDVGGDYRPQFWDGQTLLTFSPKLNNTQTVVYKTRKNGRQDTIYRAADRLTFSLLSIVQYNRFYFEPSGRQTTFGGFNNAFRLSVAFVGAEQSNYLTGQGAFVVHFRPNLRLSLKNIVSMFTSEESELVDVEGGYRLADVSSNPDNAGEELFVRGIGTELRRARNYLEATSLSVEHRGECILDRDFYLGLRNGQNLVRHTLRWGLRYQAEWIDDWLKEWDAVDSAEYIRYGEYVSAKNRLQSSRVSGYVSETWRISQNVTAAVGLRANYWTLNRETLISPRLQFVFQPQTAVQIRAAVGVYGQPPFYRELRDFDGKIFRDVKAQRSMHVIVGADYAFEIRRRPFKLFAEAFYKPYFRLVPFEFENVRIRYYPDKTAVGYAYGMDAKINGQFIPGIDSWFSLSLLRTMENAQDDDKGFIRRPTDNNVIISFFFQDEVPRLPTLKANINLTYNSGLPFGPPRVYVNRTPFQAPSYLRVDFGLSYMVYFKSRYERRKRYGVESVWVGLDVFNLFGRQNVVSYQWIEDLFQIKWAVPNYLSQRLVNARAVVKF
ncbi:MAG: TonB-dependent receptor plug domain-containing protein, partial [Bacteroidia bacterium]|nr:TonB-dependent receptor plug domain-containing protein [Bacteroidia bacterium]